MGARGKTLRGRGCSSSALFKSRFLNSKIALCCFPKKERMGSLLFSRIWSYAKDGASIGIFEGGSRHWQPILSLAALWAYPMSLRCSATEDRQRFHRILVQHIRLGPSAGRSSRFLSTKP